MSNEFIEIDIDYLTHSSAAVLVSDGGIHEAWIPFQYVIFNDQDGCSPGLFDGLERNSNIILEVQEWIAKSKGLM